jgi:hypothetical protein
MFWDGERWIDERAPVPVPESAPRRGRDWLATGVMILGIAALAVPFMATSAAVSSSHRLLESWRESYETRVFQESTAYASYSGSWDQRQDDQYLGTYAAVSGQLGARVTFTFTGSAVSWIGPEGPDQGKAAVYVDGRLVRTVDAYSRSLRPRETLFTTWFSGLTEHTLTIEAIGTTALEAASVDAFVVRGAKLDAKAASTPAPAAADPTPAPSSPLAALPDPTAQPTPTAAPIRAVAPTPVPTPTPAPPAPTASVPPTPSPTPAPGAPVATTAPTPVATAGPTPTAVPVATASPAPAPTPRPTATPTPTPSSTVRVTSIPALLTTLADDTVTEIVVADGTYRVSGAANKQASSLWIGARFAARTRPVLVRAETTGGVTFDGGGTTYFGGISFQEGAHDQTWQGFTFANGVATSTGVIMFGGYTGSPGAHHITLRDITIASSCVTSQPAGIYHDHGVYFSWSVGGVHDILIDGLTMNGVLDSAIHFYHSDASNVNAWNVTMRRVAVTGTKMAFIIWDKTLRNILVEDSTVTGAVSFAVRYESPGTGIVLRRLVSTGSGQQGFYSSAGANPSGVTFDDVNLH